MRIVPCLKKTLIAVTLVLFSALMLFSLGEGNDAVTNRKGEEGKLTIYFPYLDTEETDDALHGDCAILVSPDGKTMMIDAGHPLTQNKLLTFLKQLGITHIDYFVMSHPHKDHVGGFPYIADHIGFSEIIRSYLHDGSAYEQSFEKSVKKHNIPVKEYQTGDTFPFGEEVTVTVLSPDKDTIIPEKPSISVVNSSSLCLQFHYGESTVLFCGDLYNMGERSVMAKWGDGLKSDIVKANHHGGDTSNQSQWIAKVKPELTVVSSDNSCSFTVLSRYKKAGSQVVQTALNGNMKILVGNHHDFEVLSEKKSKMDD